MHIAHSIRYTLLISDGVYLKSCWNLLIVHNYYFWSDTTYQQTVNRIVYHISVYMISCNERFKTRYSTCSFVEHSCYMLCVNVNRTGCQVGRSASGSGFGRICVSSKTLSTTSGELSMCIVYCVAV